MGGVTDFVRKLTIGHSSNSGSFAIKRFNWHGNDKTANEVSVIYLDRDFVVGGGGTGASNVDLTPYFNGAQYTNNSGNTPPRITMLSASGNTSLNLRNS